MGNDASERGRTRLLSFVAALLGGVGLVLVVLGLIGMLGTATPNMRGFNQGQSVSVGESGMSVWSRSDTVRQTAVCTAADGQDVVLERPVAAFSVEVAGSSFFEVARTPQGFAPGTYSITCEGTQDSLYAGPRATRTVANGLMGETGLLIGGILLAAAVVLGIGALLGRGKRPRQEAVPGPYGVSDAPGPYWQPQYGGYEGAQGPQPSATSGYAPPGYAQPGQYGQYGQYDQPPQPGYGDQGRYAPPPPGYGDQGYHGRQPVPQEPSPQGYAPPGYAAPGPPPGNGDDVERTQAIYGTGEHTQAFPPFGSSQPPGHSGQQPDHSGQQTGPYAEPPRTTGGWGPPSSAEPPPHYQQRGWGAAPSAGPAPPAGPPPQAPEMPAREPAQPQEQPDEPDGTVPWLRPGAGRPEDGQAEEAADGSGEQPPAEESPPDDHR